MTKEETLELIVRIEQGLELKQVERCENCKKSGEKECEGKKNRSLGRITCLRMLMEEQMLKGSGK